MIIKGILEYSNGDRFEGEIQNLQSQGKGIYYFSNGDKYDGDFENGIPI